MGEIKQKVKVIELGGQKLDPKAKYILVLSPEYSVYIGGICRELARLIGPNFTVLPIRPDALKVFEVMPSKPINQKNSKDK